jgi:hypothetical protein
LHRQHCHYRGTFGVELSESQAEEYLDIGLLHKEQPFFFGFQWVIDKWLLVKAF